MTNQMKEADSFLLLQQHPTFELVTSLIETLLGGPRAITTPQQARERTRSNQQRFDHVLHRLRTRASLASA